MSQTRHLFRNKVVLVDKQGELRIKKTPMHPAVLFTQQVGLIGAIWMAFLLFVLIETGQTKGLRNNLTKIKVELDKAFVHAAHF